MNPGYTTTEFYSSLLGNLVAIYALIHPGIGDVQPLTQALAVLGAAIGNAVYMHSRQAVKVAYAENQPAPDPAPAPTTTASAT